MNLRETKAILKRHGISPKKILGQHFLIDEEIAKKEVEYADLNGSETVLEIGPGLGALTEHIVGRVPRLIAIEKDSSFVEILGKRFYGKDIEIVCGDALTIEIPEFDVVISNIPYDISSPFTFKLLEQGFSRGILSYQEEFAQRLVAEPRDLDYSRLSVGAYYYADIEILGKISPRAFYPSPKIRSSIVKIMPRDPPFRVDKETFFKLLQGMFTVKRKTVKNAILISKKVAGIEIDIKEVPKEIIGRRVFELRPEEFALISNLAA